MIKAVIFDMDGVLIDAREWHYEALNDALEIFGFRISREMQESRFDGLPTKVKLETLSLEMGLPKRLHKMINDIKQDRTIRLAAANCYPIAQHQILLAALKRRNLKIGVATNSIRMTSEIMLKQAKISNFLDTLVTNEDVLKAKPDPEIFLKALSNLNVLPEEALVIEDNSYGVAAAKEAGCKVLKVNDPSDVHILNLENFFEGGLF